MPGSTQGCVCKAVAAYGAAWPLALPVPDGQQQNTGRRSPTYVHHTKTPALSARLNTATLTRPDCGERHISRPSIPMLGTRNALLNPKPSHLHTHTRTHAHPNHNPYTHHMPAHLREQQVDEEVGNHVVG